MERFAEDLASWLACEGHRVTVLTQTPGGDSADGSRRQGLTVLRNPTSSAVLHEFRDADAAHVSGLSVRGIAASLATGKRPVVTHHGYQAVCPTGLALTEHGKACNAEIGPCEACPGPGVRGRIDVWLHRVAAGLAVTNVSISRYLDSRVSLADSQVVYDPVAERAFDGSNVGEEQDTNRIAFAGRLVEEKGLDLLLHALGELPDVLLEIAGDGPMRESWESLARSLDAGDRVVFHGHVPFRQVAEMYGRATVVCVPSRWDEPFGYAVAEAMAVGRPVVATPRGSFPELLAGGRGFVADEAAPAALAAALKRALADGNSRQRAARRSRAFAERRLSIDAIGPQYLEIYRKAAA